MVGDALFSDSFSMSTGISLTLHALTLLLLLEEAESSLDDVIESSTSVASADRMLFLAAAAVPAFFKKFSKTLL